MRGGPILFCLALLAGCDDSAGSDASPDLSFDAARPDATPDGARPDASPDATLDASPDAASPDDASPDAASPDDAAPDAASPDAAAPDDAALPDERPPLLDCRLDSAPTGETEDWAHLSSGLVALGDPHHTAQDVLAIAGRPLTLPGKFCYGALSADLEDEWVEVSVSDCQGGARVLGRGRTDDDGRLSLSVAPDALSLGRHELAFRVLGDNTVTRSTLYLLPEGTRLAIFDIDATLTTADLEVFRDVLSELFEPMLDGDYVPEARAGGAELTRLRRAQGRVLLYLTGRPYALTDISRGWLQDSGYADGALHVVDDLADIWPSEPRVGRYKRDFLQALVEAGFVLETAYGNATTDIYAYREAGVSPARTFIAGKHGGEGGTIAVGDNWQSHLSTAQAEVLPPQPFRE